MNTDSLMPCSRDCLKEKKCCDKEECRYFINFEKEYNCSLISIYENGPLSLREVAEREGISFTRVKQIEEQALFKLKNNKSNRFLN
jgi:hypothetical protein